MNSLTSLRSSPLHQQHMAMLLRFGRAIAIAIVTITCACLAGGMVDG